MGMLMVFRLKLLEFQFCFNNYLNKNTFFSHFLYNADKNRTYFMCWLWRLNEVAFTGTENRAWLSPILHLIYYNLTFIREAMPKRKQQNVSQNRHFENSKMWSFFIHKGHIFPNFHFFPPQELVIAICNSTGWLHIPNTFLSTSYMTVTVLDAGC